MNSKDWVEQRKAAAWYIREGRRLMQSRERFGGTISRRDNNQVFETGRRLIDIGRRIAMGGELDKMWTSAIYRAHLNATRPKRRTI